MSMDVIQIVEIGLKGVGFDGLVIPGTCGCVIGDLSPGNCLSETCQGGYKHTHSTTGDWITSVKKDGVGDAEIELCIAECG
jgi:hypothetical protein